MAKKKNQAFLPSLDRPCRILLVDDDEAIRALIQAVLDSPGTYIVEADSGASAIEQLGREQFDLLICDKKMPGINGLDVVRRARQFHPGIGALLISGYPSDHEEEEARAVGVDGILVKPFAAQRLKDEVVQVLGRKKERSLNHRPRVAQLVIGSRVLVCDPDPDSRRVLSQFLAGRGVETIAVEGLLQAMEQIRTEGVDGLFCDRDTLAANFAHFHFLQSAMSVRVRFALVAIASAHPEPGQELPAFLAGVPQVERPLDEALLGDLLASLFNP